MFAELLREGTLLTAEDALMHWRGEHHLPGAVIDRTQFRPDAPAASDLPARAADEVRRHLADYAPPAILSAEQTRDLENVMAAAAGDFRLCV